MHARTANKSKYHKPNKTLVCQNWECGKLMNMKEARLRSCFYKCPYCGYEFDDSSTSSLKLDY